MPIPNPEAGLVISYAYLWHGEHQAGQEEGRKDRPSVIVLATVREADGATTVTVLPTHTARRPTNVQRLRSQSRSSSISVSMMRGRGSLSPRATNFCGRAMICARSQTPIVMISVFCRRDYSVKSSKPLAPTIAPANAASSRANETRGRPHSDNSIPR